MNWAPDDGNDLESFLLEEVPVAKVEAEVDEFDDIDWCDIGEISKEDFDVTVQDSTDSISQPTSASTSHPSEGGETVKQQSDEKMEKTSKSSEQNTKLRKQCKALREQAVARYRILVLAFIARLSCLNHMCNNQLLQAAVLSLAPHLLDEGVKLSLRKIKAIFTKQGVAGGELPLCLLKLLSALKGGGSSLDLLMLLVAWCRSQLHPARLVLSLPLPGAKKCGDLLKGEALPEASVSQVLISSLSNQNVSIKRSQLVTRSAFS